MTTHRSVLVTAGMLAAALAAFPAHGMSTDQYLSLRRRSGWDRKLTLTVVQADPSAYAGRVIELRGAVSGTILRSDSVAFLLTMGTSSSLLLTAPANDTRLVTGVNNQRLRVLGRVAPSGQPGNVVPIETMALALDAEVTAREREAEAREAAVQSQRAAQNAAQNAAAQVSYSPRAATSSSRQGYYIREMRGTGSGLSALARQYLSPAAQSVYPAYRGFIIRHNPRLTEQELDQITVSLLYFSQKHHVDPRLVVAMIIAESDFNPRSTSNKGAMGLGQIMPDEARDNGLTNPYDPIGNVRTAVNLLKMKLNLFWEPGSQDGYPTMSQVIKALAAYNAGAGAVKRYGGVPPYRETQGYVRKILRLYGQLCGS